MTTWYMRGGSVFAVCRSTTTAPCPSSGVGAAGGGVGVEGGSTGMDSFYRVDAMQSLSWHIELMVPTARPEMRHAPAAIPRRRHPRCQCLDSAPPPHQNARAIKNGGEAWPSELSNGSTTPRDLDSSRRRVEVK